MESMSFGEVQKYPYVIIYDNSNGNKLHKTNCTFVTEENFNKKVYENRKKNGYYRPIAAIGDINDDTVGPCKVCKPDF
ncbi:hypothetical protein FOA22_24475 [Heyndrickxia oleronia]|uniref:hypothetical protein n=1 Tax=Heyndrickxia oleronia TaxID=38875 RepID=UPI0007170028